MAKNQDAGENDDFLGSRDAVDVQEWMYGHVILLTFERYTHTGGYSSKGTVKGHPGNFFSLFFFQVPEASQFNLWKLFFFFERLKI